MRAWITDRTSAHLLRVTPYRRVGKCNGHERTPQIRETAGERPGEGSTRQHYGRRAGVRASLPAAASPPGSCPRGGGHRRRASPYGLGGTGDTTGCSASSSTAVPLACHSQKSWTVPSGQPRTTPRRARPASVPILAGGSSGRTGFGSKGSMLPTWLSNYRKLRKSEHTDERSPGT